MYCKLIKNDIRNGKLIAITVAAFITVAAALSFPTCRSASRAAAIRRREGKRYSRKWRRWGFEPPLKFMYLYSNETPKGQYNERIRLMMPPSGIYIQEERRL
ncbi:MAG: hypothetical protein LBL25_01720 [Oscillospiraceae bacterium]|jgi:hypothetical protein|nr:hypothetical protein [Oscillospiraceae bacterium]